MKCTNCGYPVEPTGLCTSCRSFEGPHNGSWGRYYQAVKWHWRKREFYKCAGVFFIITFMMAFMWGVLAMSAWAEAKLIP